MTAPGNWFDPSFDALQWSDPELVAQQWFDPEGFGSPVAGVGSSTVNVQALQLSRYSRLTPYGVTGRFPSGNPTVLWAQGSAASAVSVLGIGAFTQVSSVAVEDRPSGGWENEYDRELRRRAAIRRRQKELEEETESIKEAVDREIAQLLRRQEAEDQKREELDRLKSLAQTLKAEQARRVYGDRVAVALTRAVEKGNYSALVALDRELRRARDEEEFVMLAITMILAED